MGVGVGWEFEILGHVIVVYARAERKVESLYPERVAGQSWS